MTVIASPPALPLVYPEMGSYEPDDVMWLVRDITSVAAEAGWEGRGPLGPRNANVLPRMTEPSKDEISLFRSLASRYARSTATNVGVVAELARHQRGDGVTFASIICAGVPVGVLLHRWLRDRHGVDAPHYAVSLVPGSGLDSNALRYLAEHHKPEDVVFTDGWTGSGNIALEVAASVERYNDSAGTGFNPELAVLVDHAECSTLFGTRSDTLVPSAALSTVTTGLTSKTVHRDVWTDGGHFHGVMRADRLGAADQSRWFVDLVTSTFCDVADDVSRIVRGRLTQPPALATFAGRDAARALAERFDIQDVRRIKAGVGEAVRVLVNDKASTLIVRRASVDELAPVLALATRRRVDVVQVEGLEFACVGIARPMRPIG